MRLPTHIKRPGFNASLSADWHLIEMKKRLFSNGCRFTKTEVPVTEQIYFHQDYNYGNI
jgi:hypothetical protein